MTKTVLFLILICSMVSPALAQWGEADSQQLQLEEIRRQQQLEDERRQWELEIEGRRQRIDDRLLQWKLEADRQRQQAERGEDAMRLIQPQSGSSYLDLTTDNIPVSNEPLRFLSEDEYRQKQNYKNIMIVISIVVPLGVIFIIIHFWNRLQRIAPTIWKNALAVVMLIIAIAGSVNYNYGRLLKVDDGYYTLLRIVIFLLALGGAWSWFFRKAKVWPWVFIGLAIVFNPIVKIEFDRGIWVFIDLLTIIFFVVEGYFKQKSRNTCRVTLEKTGPN